MLPLSLFAQTTVTGTVVDSKTNQPIPGVNINVQGSSTGTSTDFDGKFKLNKIKSGDKLIASFVGYKNLIIEYNGQQTIIFNLLEEANKLQEVVVQVGYGSVKKKDATGSVSILSAKDFNKGPALSADQLLVGKIAGVRITNDGGAPDAAPNIRIRGGSSLSGTNSPLIVIDGIPISEINPAGVNNPLSLVNPNDIESFSILKDASATAIYGSRASNGVIIITTKKGKLGTPQFTLSSIFSFGSVGKTVNVLDGNGFVDFVKKYYPSNTNLLGIPDPNAPVGTTDNLSTPQIEGRIIANTNWQDAIFRNTVSQDHNLSARANLFGVIPFRGSVGVNNTQGLVRTNDYKRTSASIRMTPTVLHDNLKIDFNVKWVGVSKNAIDADGAISSALNMDPTKPIYGDSPNNRFAGYYQNVTPLSSTNTLNRYGLEGGTNPLAILDQRIRPEAVNRVISNLELDYKMPFLPELRAVVNVGVDFSHTFINEIFASNALQTYQFNQSNDPNTNYVFNPGVNYREVQNNTNKLLDAYLVYTKKTSGFVSRFELQGGHSYQNFVNKGYKDIFRYNQNSGIREVTPSPENPTNEYYNILVNEGYFGRTNLDLANKYLFTFSMRADASSLFQPGNRWGYFPAAAFAWKLSDESFLKNVTVVSDIKLRVGWGNTGNSNLAGLTGYYPSSALFQAGNVNGQYLPGVNTYSALAYNPTLTWEKTTTTNFGVDFDLLKSKAITTTIDVYNKKTTDLFAKVPVPPGQALTNFITSNVGSMSTNGIEVSTTIRLIQTKDFAFSVNGNMAYAKSKIDDLKGTQSFVDNDSGLPIGTGQKLAVNAVGEQPFSALVFEQQYNANGTPSNSVVDRNGDGVIDDKDRYYVAMRPNWTFGFGTSLNYKNFDLTASFRGQAGGKVYNTRNLVGGYTTRALALNGNSFNNVLSGDLPFNNINGNTPFSDYFLENASFIRCENITLGYKFNKFVKASTLRLYVAVNNAFIITKYSGQDPENFNGIDNNFYPRPRVISAGFNFDF